MNEFETVIKSLKRCGYRVTLFDTARDAKEYLLKTCAGKRVGISSSMSLSSMGFPESLEGITEELYRHEKGEHGQPEHDALTADIYLTSANGISKAGHIVNIDGTGNRVGATIFGPKEVVYIIGKNKIVDTLPEALDRAKSTAVTMASMFKRKTPCAVTQECSECHSPECLCSVTSIHRRKPTGIDITILLINEELGL